VPKSSKSIPLTALPPADAGRLPDREKVLQEGLRSARCSAGSRVAFTHWAASLHLPHQVRRRRLPFNPFPDMQSVPHPQRVLHLAGELHSAASTRELASWAVNVLASEIGRDFAVITGFGPQGEMRSVTLADGIDPGLLPLYGPAIANHIQQDLPGLRFMVQQGAPRHTGRITDLVSQCQFDETALYNEAYRALQMRRMLGCIFRTPDGGMLSLALGRGGRDFTDGQTNTLVVLGQHLEVAMGRLLQIEALTARREAGHEFARSKPSVSQTIGTSRPSTNRAP